MYTYRANVSCSAFILPLFLSRISLCAGLTFLDGFTKQCPRKPQFSKVWIKHQPPNAGSTFQCYNIWKVLLKPTSHFTRVGVRKIRSWFFSQRGGGKAKPYKSFLQIKFISTHTHPSFFPSNSDSYCCILNLVGRFWEVWNWFSLIPFEILHLENWPWNFACILSCNFPVMLFNC